MKLSKLAVALGLFAAANVASANLLLFVADQKNERGAVRLLTDVSGFETAGDFFDRYVQAPTADDLGKTPGFVGTGVEGPEGQGYNLNRVVKLSAQEQPAGPARSWSAGAVFDDVFRVGEADASQIGDLKWFVVGEVAPRGELKSNPAFILTSADPTKTVSTGAIDRRDFDEWYEGALQALRGAGASEASYFNLNPIGEFELMLGTELYEVAGDLTGMATLPLVLMQNASSTLGIAKSVAPEIEGLSFTLAPDFTLALNAPQAVPLPAAVWLLVSALVGVGLTRRRA